MPYSAFLPKAPYMDLINVSATVLVAYRLNELTSEWNILIGTHVNS